LRVDDEQVTFDVFKSMDFPLEVNSIFCLQVSDIDQVAVKTYRTGIARFPLEVCLTNASIFEFESEEVKECARYLEAASLVHPSSSLKFEDLGTSKMSSSSKKPPKLELKPLPSSLRYAFLDQESTFPVIINGSLRDVEEEKLLRVLRDHKSTLGWTILDIKWIIPSNYMDKILMEDSF